MRELRLILHRADADHFYRLVFLLLVFFAVPFAEVIFLFYLSVLLGNYILLFMAAAVGLPAVPVAVTQVQRVMPKLREKIRDGRAPTRELVGLGGMLAAGILLITPGFISDVLGYLLLFPAFREKLARFLARRMKKSYRDIHQYLKLSALDEASARG